MSRVVVITGSTRGIGFGLARELVKRGCRVVVSSRSLGSIEAAVASIHPDGAVYGVPADVTDPVQVQALWDQAVRRFGQVDIWINNAGATTVPVPIWQVPSDQVRVTVATNLLGSIYGLQVAAAGMRLQQSGGHIFSVEGLGSKGEIQEGLLTYGATKAAVTYARRAIIRELRGSNVKVSYIRPGINVTDHLLFGADALSPERWRKTKRIFNILGDRPETTTPALADGILRAQRSGTRVAWLTNRRVAWRFATAAFRRRDLFESAPEAAATDPDAAGAYFRQSR